MEGLCIDLTAYLTPLLHRERGLECRGLRGLLPLLPGYNVVCPCSYGLNG